MRIRDEGSGFDPAQVANPLQEENLLRPHGRGLLLMRTLMEELTFSREQVSTPLTLQ